MAQDALNVMQPFALHDEFRSHTGSSFLMDDGAITSLSRKQGMNTRSSTEVEVVVSH